MAFVPSLDLVITRQTGSSGQWECEQYLRLSVQAVLDTSAAHGARNPQGR
ncbi:MAG: hypothetical protein NTX87_19725 [Planctomycetota bacterium]|nr:hypothetical protein [Planctomycetota bacterium]